MYNLSANTHRKPLSEKTIPAAAKKTPPRLKQPANVKSNVVSPTKRKPLYAVKVNRLTADRLGCASSKTRSYSPTPSRITSLTNGKGSLTPTRYGINSTSTNNSSRPNAPTLKQSKVETSVTNKRGTINRYGLSSTTSRQTSVPVPSTTTRLRTSANISKPKPKESKLELLKKDYAKKLDDNAKCTVAFATLLDYVVNKIYGLSAPKLSQQKQQLEQVAVKNNETIEQLQSIVNKETNINKELGFKLNEVMDTLENERKKNVTKINEIKEAHSLELEDLSLEHESNQEEWKIEVELKCGEIEELKTSFNQRVKQELQAHEERYHNANAESRSLREVLAMRETESHKLKQELAKSTSRMQDIKTLEDFNSQQLQKIEDLQSQLHAKSNENRALQRENIKMRRSLDEQRNNSSSQERKIEELTYRLNSSTPTPTSPFNPVFTTSPSGAQANGVFETPKRGKSSPVPFREGDFLNNNNNNEVVSCGNVTSG